MLNKKVDARQGFHVFCVKNKNFLRKNCRKIDWHRAKRAFVHFGLKETSSVTYSDALMQFVKYVKTTENITDFSIDKFPEIGLEKIEDYMTDFIADNRDTLAPKYLNLIYNAVKRWCYITKMIKSTKMFKEIKFDKSSRKTSGLMETMLETRHIKTMFKIAELNDKVDLGLYALVGLRPQIIPQLKVKDLYPKDYTINNGKIKFTKKPPICIIPRKYKGNKGNITFMVFIPSKLSELIEMRLNANGVVTPETKISEADNEREI